MKKIIFLLFSLVLIFSDANALTLDEEIDKTYFPAFSYPVSNLCEPIHIGYGNLANYSNKINVVIFPYGISGTDEEIKARIRYLLFDTPISNICCNSLFDIEPFKSRENDINIWYHKDIGVNTSISGYDNAYLEKSKECPVNFVFVITRTGISARSCVKGIAHSTNTENTLTYELGGLIGCLSDEWVYPNQNVKVANLLNCDPSPTCDKFNFLGISTCYKGCTYEDYYREQYYSVLNGLGNSFGVVGEYIINKRMNILIAKNTDTEHISVYPKPSKPPLSTLWFTDIINSVKIKICSIFGVWC